MNNTIKKSNIEVKVIALNTLNEYAEKIILHELNHFTKFIGKDVFKVNGTITQKYENEKLDFKGTLPDGTHYTAHSWLSFSRYSGLQVTVKICVNGGSYDVHPSTAFCQYEQLTTTLLNTDNGVLLETNNDFSYLKKRYDIKELIAISKEIENAAKVYEDIYNKMPYQFTDVFYISRLTRN